jgi:homoserine kinase
MSRDNEFISVFAPASIANFGPGFDIVAVSIDNIGDIIHVRKSDEVRILEIIGDNNQLSYNPLENTAGIASLEVLKLIKKKGVRGKGVDIIIEKGIPLNSGMGSSAASAVAAAVATDILFGKKLSTQEVLKAALQAEKSISGEHLDNVAASLFGGFVLVANSRNYKIHRVINPFDHFVTIVKPNVKYQTKDARAILPDKISLSSHILNLTNLSTFVHSLHTGNENTFYSSIVDNVIEPVRSKLIPNLFTIKEIAKKAGAKASSISGSGPSVFFVCEDEQTARKVALKVTNFLRSEKIGTDWFIVTLGNSQAKRIENGEINNTQKQIWRNFL